MKKYIMKVQEIKQARLNVGFTQKQRGLKK